MTEAEWLAATDAGPMLTFLRGKMSDRKLRLFAAAVARLLGERLSFDQWRAIAVAERLADGLASEVDRLEVADRLWYLAHQEPPSADPVAHRAAAIAAGRWDWDPEPEDMGQRADWAFVRRATPERQPPLLRDIFGNPFRPVTLDPSWRTSDVMLLAQGIYDDRAFDRMPILADALQDAGCDNDDVLDHCRDPHAAHVRGCWVVDLVLGKE